MRAVLKLTSLALASSSKRRISSVGSLVETVSLISFTWKLYAQLLIFVVFVAFFKPYWK